MNKLKTAIPSFFACLLSASCTATAPPPDVAYNGEPVSFPIQFGSFPGFAPVCKYEMGGQKGTVKIPNAVVFKFTDQEQTLKLECEFNDTIPYDHYNIYNITAFKHEGTILFDSTTSFRQGTRYSSNYTGDSRRIKVSTNSSVLELRGELIRTKGVQILAPYIMIATAGDLKVTKIYKQK